MISDLWKKHYESVNLRTLEDKSTLYNALKVEVKKHPDFVALEHGREIYTYKRLLDEIDLAAEKFSEIGIDSEDTVMIAKTGLPSSIISIYALSKIGASISMISEFVKELRFVELANLNKCTYLITSGSTLKIVLPVLKMTSVKAVILSGINDYMKIRDMIMPNVRIMLVKNHFSQNKKDWPSDIGLFMWKKLMTGKCSDPDKVFEKKKNTKVYFHHGTASGTRMSVQVSEGEINDEAELSSYLFDAIKNYYPQEQFRILSLVEASFTYGFCFAIHTALLTGNILLLCAADKDKLPAMELILYKPDILIGYPNIIMQMMDNRLVQNSKLDFLKLIYSGGEIFAPIKYKMLKEFLDSHNSKAGISSLYGFTETLSVCAYNPVTLNNTHILGIPLPGVYIKICDSHTMAEKNIGEIGEIFVSTPGTMERYVDNPEATDYIKSVNKSGRVWIRTGDLGKLDEKGYLYYEGTTKNMCSKDGLLIYPTVIEEEILSVYGVKEAAVIIAKDDEDRFDIVAMVVPFTEYMFDNELLETLKTIIENDCSVVFSEPMRPSRIEFRAYLPKTAYSKIDYDKLLSDWIDKQENRGGDI